MKAITTKYHCETATKPARYSASDCDGNRAEISAFIVPDGLGHDLAAVALCRRMRWGGPLMRGHLGMANVYVFVDDSAIVLVPEAPLPGSGE